MNEAAPTGDVMPGYTVSFLYDVRSWYASFDFIAALGFAEACRRVWHPLSSGIEVVIVSGRSRWNFSGLKFESGYTSSEDHDRQRLHKLLLPLSDLVPSVRTVTVLDTTLGQKPSVLGKTYIYPGGVDVDQLELEPMSTFAAKARMMFAAGALTDIRMIENSPVALNDARAYAKRLSGFERPVVFTLRNNKFTLDASRDRDTTQSYLEIAERIAERYPVILVPDTADVPTGVATRLPVAYEAALCIRLRSALYEAARANFCGNSGPAILLQWNKNCAYYHSNLISGAYTPAHWQKQWDVADAILGAGTLDPRGTARARLQQNRSGPNFYAAEASHQVCDFEDLTVAKAETFLAALTAMGR